MVATPPSWMLCSSARITASVCSEPIAGGGMYFGHGLRASRACDWLGIRLGVAMLVQREARRIVQVNEEGSRDDYNARTARS